MIKVNFFGLNFLYKVFEVIDINVIIIVFGNKVNLEFKVEWCNKFCIKIGKIVFELIIDIIVIFIIMILIVNCLFLNIVKFNNGVDSWYWCNINNVIKIMFLIIDINMIGLLKFFFEIEFVLYNNLLKFSIEKMIEIKLIGILIVVLIFFIVLNLIKNVIVVIGVIIWKSDL